MFLSFLRRKMSPSSEFDRLVQAAIELGNRPAIMPIEEIQLAHALSTLPDIEQVVGRLHRELFDHQNMHVRRIAVNACRHAKVFDCNGLKEAVTRKLEDSEAWVRYDAVWLIQAAGYDSSDIRRLLGAAAAECAADDEAILKTNRGNAEIQARLKARAALDGLVIDRCD